MSRTYFDTPARAERLQLLLHLVRNAGEVIYLRAPAGAGKTLFVHRLLDILGNDLASVWIRGGIDDDVAEVAADQLGLSSDEAANWPDGLLGALGGQDLLLVADDAEQLALTAVERLASMHARGGRVLLLGHGGLARATGEWDVQYVDLPPFTVEQSAAFLRSNAGDEAASINDDLAGFLHHSAQGRPGPLLDSLEEVLDRARHQATRRVRRQRGDKRSPWPWLAGIAVAILVAVVLLYQDRINALFEPPTVAESRPAPGPDVSDDGRSVAATPQPLPAGPQAEDLPPNRPPPIALPELSRLPATGAEPDAKAPADESAGADTRNPLDAVMRDALVADQARVDAEPADAVPAGSAAPSGDAADRTSPPGPVVDDGTPSDVAANLIDPPPQPRVTAVVAPSAPAAAVVELPTPGPPPRAKKPSADVGTLSGPTPAAGVSAIGPAGEMPAPVEERPTPLASVDERRPEPAVEPAAGPAPVVERSKPVVAVTDTLTPTTAPAAQAPALKEVPAGGGLVWLKSRKPGHFTLQLVGARDRRSVEKFVREHRVTQPYAIFERDLGGRPWFSLVAGDYRGRDAAVTARGRLPKTLARSDIWPRTFASIQETLQ